ncbi:hypothetical protein SLS55_005442 [Diplodia seriata]|uniref:Uncharacterized protein n=1 Tax=Diplodia seriata TaxID=420778 RepID=A0ABR3CGE2_9PEZI
MDKLKDIFSPGHKQDADTLYGSQQPADPSSRTSKDGRLSGEGSHLGSSRDNTTDVASSGLTSNVGAAKGHGRNDTMGPHETTSTTTAPDTATDRGQGFARQSAKPDDSRYGREESAAAATSSLPDRTAGGVHSTPATEQDTSYRQHTSYVFSAQSTLIIVIFGFACTDHYCRSLGGSNYADQRYDSSAAHEPAPTRFSPSSGLEPVGGVSRSSERGQGIVGAQPTTGNLRPSEFADGDDISVASVRSGVIGDTPHAKQLTDSDLPAGNDHSSSAGRGLGPGAAAAAAGTAAALGSRTERGSDNEREFPLSGGTHTNTSGARSDYTSRNEPSALGSTAETSTSAMPTHGPDDSRRALAAAAGATPFDMHKHHGHYHEYEGPNTDTTGSGLTFSPGPHATEAGNRLDPSLPSSSMPGAYPDSASATPATEEPSTINDPSSHEHHYGRDAAIAGAGAATAGGLYGGHSRGSTGLDPTREAETTHRVSPQDQERDAATAGARAAALGGLDHTGTGPPVEGDRSLRISSQDYGSDAATAGAAAATRGPHGTRHGEPSESTSVPKSQTSRDAPSQEHHYGRDAAIAGTGATAAAGLYEARRKGSTETDPATSTHGPHKSNVANIMDPRVLPDPNKMKGHQAQSTETDPASRTVGPHSSNVANVMDPRVLPQPEKMKQHTTAGPHQSDTLNRMDRKVDSDPASEANQHHYGRDAAVAGGLGAGAAGAYAASQHHQEKNPYTSHAVDPRIHNSSATSGSPARSSSTKGGWFAGPTGSAVDTNNNASRTPTRTTGSTGVDSSAQPGQQHHYGRDAAIAGGAGLAGAGLAHQYGDHQTGNAARDHAPGTADTSAPYSSNNTQPISSTTQATHQPQTTSTTQPTSQHHYGRDAALAGGVGAGGLGAYEYQKREAEKAERTHPYGSTASATGPVHDQARSSTDPSRDPANADQKHHYGRDAAVAGTAGAAGAGAAHEFSKHDAEKAEKERIKEQKEHEKEAMKQQKELDKEQQKDNKKYQKELEKDEKKHEKELEKEEKKHEKEEKKKHGGGLFGFLHRDKNKEGDRSSLSSSSSDDDEKRHRREAGAVAAGGAGAAAYEHEDGKHERHRLHKDPPAEYVKAHGGEHYGTDGRIGEAGAVSGTQ